jgi:hypothetical protein
MSTLLGCIACLGLLARSRFRLRGKYWQWRWETAFGRGAPDRQEMVKATLEYARWVHRMRTLR